MSLVFDSSALLAAIFGEPGGDHVLQLVSDLGGSVSAVNWAEVATKMSDNGVKPKQVQQELSIFRLVVVPLDSATALKAAELREGTKHFGLSLGDRCCLALAAATPAAVVVTADRVWKSLKGFDVQLIR
jgi:ribonuclease VapC